MTFTDWAMSLGGIGFLLLGMGMMTEGLKGAAGDSLRTILERSTRTRMHALLTGFSMTALVQSSSAVIMTTLGFTNAGMLTMRRAAWLVFGSNVGTTLTAWIVALIGLKIRVDVVALPLIGLGMLLHLFLRGGRWKHIGFAAAGFGVLFFGLGALSDAFDNIATVFPVEQIAAAGLWGIVLGILVGAALTLLIQSSSAALAIILTAAATGVFSPLVGASLVIGANIGTTGTSILAALGATANARRLAWVHVLQKCLTSVIALALLWPMMLLADYIAAHTGSATIATALAVYHTLFNVLGVLLMWAFADRLFRFVERMIKQPELTSEQPRYLDKTVLTSAAMGVGAMHSELKRVFKQLLRRGSVVLAFNDNEPVDVNTKVLLGRISEFADELGQVEAMGEHSESYLNLVSCIRELTELRFNINTLREFEQREVAQTLGEPLVSLLGSILGSGRLKALDREQRDAVLLAVKNARQQRRSAVLLGLRGAEVSGLDAETETEAEIGAGANQRAPNNGNGRQAKVTRQLAILASSEQIAKHIIRSADVLYPVDAKSAPGA